LPFTAFLLAAAVLFFTFSALEVLPAFVVVVSGVCLAGGRLKMMKAESGNG
jgi:hypothetical protein